MKKLLVFGVIALFIGLAFIPSFNAESIKEETSVEEDREENYSPPKLVGFPIHHKDYYNCEVTQTGYLGGVSGRAFLFPGYFKSRDWFIDVENAKGFLYNGGDIYDSEFLLINGDQWYADDWIIAIVIGYTGEMYNRDDYPIGGDFLLDGYASFVRIYY